MALPARFRHHLLRKGVSISKVRRLLISAETAKAKNSSKPSTAPSLISPSSPQPEPTVPALISPSSPPSEQAVPAALISPTSPRENVTVPVLISPTSPRENATTALISPTSPQPEPTPALISPTSPRAGPNGLSLISPASPPLAPLQTVTATAIVPAPVFQRSRLLTLPAELRDHILSLALVQEQYITVNPALRVPGILQVCRQLREESTPIWYLRNNFKATIHNCDGASFTRWSFHQYRVSLFSKMPRERLALHYEYTGVPDWQNLKFWLWVRWHRRDPSFPLDLPAFAGTPKPVLARNFFRAAHELLESYLGHPQWVNFDLMAERMRSLVLAADVSWL